MEPSYSTVVSDAALASSAAWCLWQLNGIKHVDVQFGKWWFIFQIIAASLGVLKFGRFLLKWQEQIENYHKKFSWMTMAIGLPCLGSQFCMLHGFVVLSQVFLASATISFVVCSRRPNLKEKLPMAVAIGVVLSMLLLSIRDQNFNLFMTTLFLILSSIVGDDGFIDILKMSKVDVLHYLLVAANIFTVKAISPLKYSLG